MPLPAGTRLGRYEVRAPLGAGGMGEVYRAFDTTLGREVALKTLPEAFTQDAERLARLRREAQLLAALNHPHIAGIYAIEEVDGRHLLVLELVDGVTLADRLRRGPMTIDEAVGIGREIALALEAAHERGIVHRDLKPGNIALAPDGTVKVLDFGLARADTDAVASSPDLRDSLTISSPVTLTALGTILGTAAYMSPEQARGGVADRRSDVWAFGCVLYEMLTGARAFRGRSAEELLSQILEGQPDWSTLPPGVPIPVKTLLEGCLEKDPRKRIGDMSAARFVLERGPALVAPAPSHRSARWTIPAVLGGTAAFVLGVLGMIYALRQPPASAPVTRFAIPMVQGQDLGLARRVLAISPDGTRLAYVAGNRLFIRAVSEFEARPVPGTEGALQPAFSPDGESLAFWAEGAVKRVSISGGAPVRLYDVSPAPFGITWGPRGIIVVELGQVHVGILQLPPEGGSPTRLVPFTDADGLLSRAEFLPDGETLLFARGGMLDRTNIWGSAQIVLHSVRTGQRKVLLEGGSDPVYVPTGHIIYMTEGSLMAVPFDAGRGELTGSPVPVVEGVRRTSPAVGGEGQFAVSPSGTLMYVPGPVRAGDEMVFIYSGDGTAVQLPLRPGMYGYPRASPDGNWLAFQAFDGKHWSIAVYHMSGTSAMRRLTFEGNNRYPVWSPDSRYVAFQSDRDGPASIFRQPIAGGPAERLTNAEAGTAHIPDSWSGRDDVLLYTVDSGDKYVLWALSLKDRTASPVDGVVSLNYPLDAAFSPDGRWIAYQTGDGRTGEATTFVQPFPPTGLKHEIGLGGRPAWARKGMELYFIPGPGRLAVTRVTSGPVLANTAPQDVQRRFGLSPPGNPRMYDFLPDGRLVGINRPDESGSTRPAEVHVVQNWFEELKAKSVPQR